MKILILLIISAFIFLFGGNKCKNDLQRQSLNGKVKCVAQITFSVAGNPTDIDSSWYDVKGESIQLNQYSAEGKLWSSQKATKFDDCGSPVRITYYQWHEEDYGDGSGKVQTKLSKTQEFFKLEYDGNGNNTVLTLCDSNGSRTSRFICKYDNMGYNTRTDAYDDKKRIGWDTYKYDVRGFVIEDKSYDQNGNMIYKTTMTIDSIDNVGNWTKKSYYNNKSLSKVLRRKIIYY